MNPPMCAHTATPLDTSGFTCESDGKAVITCTTNHHINTSHAGTGITRMMMMKMKSMLTRTLGYNTR